MKDKATILLIAVSIMTPAALAVDGQTEHVLVIGLDGADWDVIRPLMAEGELPHIGELVDDGRYGNLTTTLPIESPVAWTSMTTGTEPGKHGIYGFMERKGGRFVPTDSGDVRVDRVWEQANGTSVIINIPQTFPPQPINGSLISGYLSIRDAGYTHPSELQEEIESMGYAIEALNKEFEPGMEDAFLDRLNGTVRNRTRVASELLSRENWTLGFVVYTGLDRIQHYLWTYRDEPGSPYSDAIADHYRLLDEQIGRLVEGVGENTTVMLVSDHGFSPLKKNVYLNTWLRQQGYLQLERGKNSGGGWLAAIGLTQQNVIDTLSSVGLLEPVTSFLDWIGVNPGTSLPAPELSDIDFNMTEAYAGNYGGRIYIPDPVPEKRRDALLDTLQDRLMEITDPETGKPVFRSVHRARDLYGATIANAPDLVIEPRTSYRVVGFLGHKKVVKKPPKKSGTHARDGIYVISGASRKGHQDAHITDIAPTILDALGEDVPTYMDGTSLLSR